MWIEIPAELITAELEGHVPQDTILALAASLMGMKNLNQILALDALEMVTDGIEMGRIVTSTGEIIPTTKERSAKTFENHPSEPLENDSLRQIGHMFKTTWPDSLTPDIQMCQELYDTSGEDMTLIEDLVTMLEASEKPITTPPVLALWWLNNREHATIREAADIVRKKTDDTTFIQRALKEADAKMRMAEKPSVTEAHIERLQALRERLRG